MTTVTQTGITVETAIEAALRQLNVSQEEVEIEILDEGRKGFLGIGARDAKVKVTVKEKDESIEEEKLEVVLEEESEEGSAQEEVVQVENVEEEQASEGPVKSVEALEDEADEVTETEEAGTSGKNVKEGKDPITAATQYLTNIAQEMGIHDLDISTETDGKYIYFQLESEKAALLIGKRGQTLHALQLLGQLVANQYSENFKVLRINVGDYRERREESLERLANRMADKAVSSNRKVQLEPMLAYERKVIHNALSNRLDIETYSEGTEPHRYLVIEPIR